VDPTTFITIRCYLPTFDGFIDGWAPIYWTKESFKARTTLDEATRCWVWTSPRSGNGYGWASPTFAYRVAYVLFKGPLSPELEPDHLCKNKLCVNPDHLEAVTKKVNILRSDSISAKNARKIHCKHGHLLEGDNLKIRYDKKGRPHRVCITCERMRAHETRRRARENTES
jgi:hypothetical protein